MNPSVFRALRDLAYEKAGIALGPEKEVLLATRLAKRMRDLGVDDERAYLARLQADRSGAELVQFIDAISTNFTRFFREPDHFELLDAEVRRMIARSAPRLRVWCAAASSGEEPYSIALTLAEAPGIDRVDHRILATDISTRMIGLAKRGYYTEAQLEPVPRHLREKYFPRIERSSFRAAATELKARLVFARLNLAKPPFPMKGPLDVVMCRNVMIYFDSAVRQRLVREIERLLRPGGLLLVGHAETLNGLATSLVMVRPSAYRKVNER